MTLNTVLVYCYQAEMFEQMQELLHFFLLLVKGVDVTWEGFLAYGVSGWTANWVRLLPQKSQYFAAVSIFGKLCGPQETLVVIHWMHFQELKNLLLQHSK